LILKHVWLEGALMTLVLIASTPVADTTLIISDVDIGGEHAVFHIALLVGKKLICVHTAHAAFILSAAVLVLVVTLSYTDLKGIKFSSFDK